VRLTAGGQTRTAPLTVRMDPRVRASDADIRQQYELSRSIDAALRRLAPAVAAARARGEATATRVQELQRLAGSLAQLFGQVEGADVAPSSQLAAAVREAVTAADRALAQP
jgi:hypothetical protein